MKDIFDRQMLLLSLQRALLGEVHPDLRQASIEADPEMQIVSLRFEYDGNPSTVARESCSCAATEVISDFPDPWKINEQHCAVPMPSMLSPLAHIAYLRAEPRAAA
jgi:hypothetical protein